MDGISGIDNNMINYSIENAKNKATSGEFESQLKKAYSEKDDKELKKECKNFEQIFLKMMYDQMRATIPKSGLTEQGMAEDTFQDMFYDKISQEVADGPGIGLANMMYKNLSKQMNNTYTQAGDKQDAKTETVSKEDK